jgi:hypothetical protein
MAFKNPTVDLINPSDIENIDFAFYDWLDQTMNIFCNTADGFKKVPVLWVSPERSFQIKSNKEFYDINGAIIPPVITIERTTIAKDSKNNGTYFTNLPPSDNRILISVKMNQQKTAEFTNAAIKKTNKGINFLRKRKELQKTVYQFQETILPVYISITYNINILTQYQQQMNEIIQPLLVNGGSRRYFLIERNGHRYECFPESNLETQNNIANMEAEERKYISKLSIKVLGNVASSGINENDALIKTHENAVELILNKDKNIFK